MDDDDDSVGWGRPRPKFSDLLPSTPEHSDDDGQMEMDTGVGDEMDILNAAADNERPRVKSNILRKDIDVGASNRVVPLIDFPLTMFVGAPVGELNQMYMNKGLANAQVSSLKKEFYTSFDNGLKSPNTRFTSIFTCPVTGEHFGSGSWESEKGVSIAEVVDEVCWYRTKKNAQIAAAARALDCFSLRRCRKTEKEPSQRCVDSPYLTASGAPKLPELPPGIALPVPFSQGQDETPAVPNAAPLPRRHLNDWYMSFAKRLGVSGIVIDGSPNELGPGVECYTSFHNMEDSHLLWTSLFTCHLSGERFPSGTLIGKESVCKEDYWYFDPRHSILIPKDVIEKDDSAHNGNDYNFSRVDFVWYKTKKEAIDAAAGRALDCMKHRDSRGADPCDRYCKELPYTVEDTSQLWKKVSESVNRYGTFDCAYMANEHRMTTMFGVASLHDLLDDQYDEEYWRARYRNKRES